MKRACQQRVTEPRIPVESPTGGGTSNGRSPVVVSGRADGRERDRNLTRPPRRCRLRVPDRDWRPVRLRPVRRAPPSTSPPSSAAGRPPHPGHGTAGVGGLVDRRSLGLRRHPPARAGPPRPGGPGRPDRHLLAPWVFVAPWHPGPTGHRPTGPRAHPTRGHGRTPSAPPRSPGPPPHHLLAPTAAPAPASHRHEATERPVAGPPLAGHARRRGFGGSRCRRAPRPQRCGTPALSVVTGPAKIGSVLAAPGRVDLHHPGRPG
jgi:hypothetical protein